MKRCFPLLFIAAIAASSYACASNDQKSAETADVILFIFKTFPEAAGRPSLQKNRGARRSS